MGHAAWHRDGSGRQRLGRYEILARLGAGGMAAVYKARDVDSGRIVALKVLPPELAGRPNWIKRFSREALTSARLNHPNLVDVFELNEAAGVHYIAMEYVDGLNLEDYVTAKGKLPPEEVVEIAVQAARALEHMRQQGIVHRDVKPSNLLLTLADGKRLVKLADLGLALDTLTEDQSRLTRHGVTVGTADYMAPEQVRGGGQVDVRSDLYSLGCTMYHLLTGAPPFAQAALAEKLYRHAHVMPPDPRDANPLIPDDLLHILGKLLTKRPEDRYQTPAELLLDLERLQHLRTSAAPAGLAGLADPALADQRGSQDPPRPAS